jgi:hypothetical protein
VASGTEGDVDAGDAEQEFLPGLFVVRGWIGGGGAWLEELLAEGDGLVARGVGKESIVADAHESGGEDVKQEAPEELGGVEGHAPGLVAMGPVAPAEGDLAVLDRLETVVGDGDAVCVATEVAENLFGTGVGIARLLNLRPDLRGMRLQDDTPYKYSCERL